MAKRPRQAKKPAAPAIPATPANDGLGTLEHEPSALFSDPDGGRLSRSDFMDALNPDGGDAGKDDQGGTQKPTANADDQLADALSDDGGDTGKPDDQGGGDAKPAPKTLADLAERLEVDVKDLYAIEFPAADDGKPQTLGQLKDMLAKETDLETRSNQFAENQTKGENELLRAKQDLQMILQALPKDAIKPEVLKKVRADAETHRAVEESRTLEAIPTWSNDDARAKDRAGMLAHLEAYGYGAGHLDTIVDHRMLKYVRDNWLREQRITQALERVKERKPASSSHAPSRPAGAKPPPPITSQPPGSLRGAIADLNANAAKG